MLKAVFVGSRDDFDEMIVHWLSRHTDLVGVVWTTSTCWQKTWKRRIQFLRKRLKRRGFWKTIDEVLFYFCYHVLLHPAGTHKLQELVLKPYTSKYGTPCWAGDSITSGNVNSPEVLKFLSERQPDVTFAICISEYFSKELLDIPRLGVFLWHEGITPEYRGLYSPFWAIHNLDFQHVGYTLLQMNEKYDDGPIFVQGPVQDIDFLRDTHCYIGHKGIADSLSQVGDFLMHLENGTAQPIVRPRARSRYYTYPGISHYLRQRLRLRRVPELLGVQRQLRAKSVE